QANNHLTNKEAVNHTDKELTSPKTEAHNEIRKLQSTSIEVSNRETTKPLPATKLHWRNHLTTTIWQQDHEQHQNHQNDGSTEQHQR
ncbi:6620_t:CDS:1, partial [Ambispora leptoticha]